MYIDHKNQSNIQLVFNIIFDTIVNYIFLRIGNLNFYTIGIRSTFFY